MVQNQKSYQRMMFLLSVVLPVILTAVMLTVFTFDKGYKLLKPLLCSQGDTIIKEDGAPTEYYDSELGGWRTSVETLIYCVDATGQRGRELGLVSFVIYLSLSFLPSILLVWIFFRVRDLYNKLRWGN